MGLEAAGVVEACGDGVSAFQKGDEVFGFTVFGTGGVSDFALADEKKITKKPSSLPWQSAGSIPTAYLTGYQCLREHGGLQPGGAVLVIGASGGCGIAGVQLLEG